MRGSHSAKMGGELQLIRSAFIDLADASGTFSFASTGDYLANAPSRFRQSFGNISRQKNTYTGLFVHDEWRANSRLMLSYGVRYENESILRDRNNWAPRLGVVLDPLGSGKTAVRFGAGVFYNRALLRMCNGITSLCSSSGMLTSHCQRPESSPLA
ncbi:MAG: TonB-dependent receptor [Pyrinomonadaceae bacterium]